VSADDDVDAVDDFLVEFLLLLPLPPEADDREEDSTSRLDCSAVILVEEVEAAEMLCLSQALLSSSMAKSSR
jgi:hypothetical protein